MRLPPVRDAAELRFVKQQAPDAPGLACCWQQAEPARKLPRLGRVPILIVTSEASYHAAYDHCTSQYLIQAGVPHTFTRLEAAGIHGNGHMMMLEKNSQVIAAYLQKWLTANLH